MTRRLHLRIFVTLIAIVVVTAFAAGGLAALRHRNDDGAAWLPVIETVVDALPPPGDPRFGEAMDRMGDRLRRELTLRDADGRVQYSTGRELPDGDPGWWWSGEDHGVRVVLSDGRRLSVTGGQRPRPGAFGVLLLLTGVVFGVGTWPVARSITRRLESLNDAAGRWGDGDLSARAQVIGEDEVARVATTFNRAADRVEALITAQRRVLASASHELRSPLARLRMALELIDDGPWVSEAIRDVEELDATVGDLLQVGRLQAVGLGATESVDLLALLTDEGGAAAAAVSGPAIRVTGDRRLLRRLLRNLLENAARHGGGHVEAWTTGDGLVVADRGPGVPQGEAEAIFEPFHRPAGHAEGRDGGVGLGLWLVREIAAAHGGAVVWRPRDGGGSLFEVRLPVAPRADEG